MTKELFSTEKAARWQKLPFPPLIKVLQRQKISTVVHAFFMNAENSRMTGQVCFLAQELNGHGVGVNLTLVSFDRCKNMQHHQGHPNGEEDDPGEDSRKTKGQNCH